MTAPPRAKEVQFIVWLLDFPEYDPDSNYREPSAKPLVYGEETHLHAKALKKQLQRLTVPQQREILAELVGSAVRRKPSQLHPHPKVSNLSDVRKRRRK